MEKDRNIRNYQSFPHANPGIGEPRIVPETFSDMVVRTATLAKIRDFFFEVEVLWNDKIDLHKKSGNFVGVHFSKKGVYKENLPTCSKAYSDKHLTKLSQYHHSTF